MRKGLSWLFTASLGCAAPASRGSEPPPADTQPPPADTQPPAVSPEPGPPPPSLELGELGWARVGSSGPASPLLRLEHYDSHGPAAELLTLDILQRLEPIHACFEGLLAAEPGARMTLVYRVRLGDGPEDGVEIQARPTPPPATQACLRRALADADQGHTVEARAGLVVRLQLYAQAREAPPLRAPGPEDRTAARLGGTCWTWEDYPCAPNKRCKADEWVRSACPP